MLRSILFLIVVLICPLFANFDPAKYSVENLISRAYTEVDARQNLCSLIEERTYIETGHLYAIDLKKLFPGNNFKTQSEASAFLRVAHKQKIKVPDEVVLRANKFKVQLKSHLLSEKYKKAIQTGNVQELRFLDTSGYKKATYRLACLYYGDFSGGGLEKDYEQARLYFENCLYTKDARLKLAEIYDKGFGVPLNPETSLKHVSDAANSRIPGVAERAHYKLAVIYKESDVDSAFHHYHRSGKFGQEALIDFIFNRQMGDTDSKHLLALAIENNFEEVKSRFKLFDMTQNIEHLTHLLDNQDPDVRRNAHLTLATYYKNNNDKVKVFEHSYLSGKYNTAQLSNFVFDTSHNPSDSRVLLEKAIDCKFEENRARYCLYHLLIKQDILSNDELDYAQKIYGRISYDYLCVQIKFHLEVLITSSELKKLKSDYSGQSLARILYNIGISHPDINNKAIDLAKDYAGKTREVDVLGAIAFLRKDWNTAISYNYKKAECYAALYSESKTYSQKFEYYHQAIQLGATFPICSVTKAVLDFLNKNNCSFDYSAGVLLYNLYGNEIEAIKFFEREIGSNRNNPSAYFALASIYLSRNFTDYEKGKKNLVALQKVLEAEPKLLIRDDLTRGLFAKVLNRKKENPHDSLFYAGGMVFYNTGKYEQSRHLFSWALEADPNNGPANYMLGTIYFNHENDIGKTRDCYKKASSFGITEATEWLKKHPESSEVIS